MDYSSSEDDKLIEDFTDIEEDASVAGVDQHAPHHFLEHGENSMASIDTSNGDLFSDEADIKIPEPFIGMVFDSDSAARTFYNNYAIQLGFGIRVARSRREKRKGVDVLVMKRFVCLKEGHHKKKTMDYAIKKKRKRLSVRDGCPAMMEVVRRAPDKWVITKLVLDHTHVTVSPDRINDIQFNRLSGKDKEHDDCLDETRLKVFGGGDAQILLEYFRKAQSVNSGFFYNMQVDSRNRITNIFWADVRARLAYNYFGDAVTFDTSYKKNENMLPFATFIGLNHHGKPVNFGCALVIDKTKSSFTWLFETWSSAMYGPPPLSFTTDQGNAIEAAVAKVFSNTRHRLCKWRILSRCKKKLFGIYPRYPTIYHDLKKCVISSDTPDAFEGYWGMLLDKYGLQDNAWLQSIFNIRNKWVPAYIKDSFFAELSTTQRLETMNQFFRKHFDSKTPLIVFINKFNEVNDTRYEKEAEDDFASLNTQPIMKTNSPMEKQAWNIYTKSVFEKFQVELTEALEHYAVKIQDGHISKYSIGKDGDVRNRHFVAFNTSEKKVICTCFKHEVSGVLCRHMLVVLVLNGVVLIPDHHILKRWTKKAKSGLVSIERGIEVRRFGQDSSSQWYANIFNDAINLAAKGAASAQAYKFAKEMLQKAFSDIVDLKSCAVRTLK